MWSSGAQTTPTHSGVGGCGLGYSARGKKEAGSLGSTSAVTGRVDPEVFALAELESKAKPDQTKCGLCSRGEMADSKASNVFVVFGASVSGEFLHG